ncbi:hypothetical protein [Parahaliea mediterranea]|uniref:Uncharacterized protein n=1 Tax=Parahaliea mediterranea TaxID=651086 RepID=A0A939IIP2_9GAMM|nr:hypothetical protein [Parahaliea mediterranea]MBN7796814.1 hypothetical protein [Parahaliea mediterranea]
MKMSFLCVRHRRWLAADPAAAMFTWLQCYEQGLRLEQQRQDNLAIRQAGCAMETADLLLAGSQCIGRDDITRYTHSALLLARLLRRQHAFDLAGDVAHSAICSLERLLIAGVQREAVTAACEQLAPLAGPCAGPSNRNPSPCARQLH